MKINFSFIMLMSVLIISSCSKDEGEGGTSTIKGKVFAKTYDNSFHTLLSQSYAPDQDVFIIYGSDHETYDNDSKTSYNGEYEFKYLQKGTYKIFAYTTDTTGVSITGYVDENKPKIPVFATIDISENGSTVTAPDLTILNSNNRGSSTIRGFVVTRLYDNTFTFLIRTYPSPDEDVFIISGTTNETYFDDTKTSYNGEFVFNELPAGDYRIFSYSTDTTGVYSGSVDETLPKTPIFIDVNVPGNGMEVNATDTIIILEY